MIYVSNRGVREAAAIAASSPPQEPTNATIDPIITHPRYKSAPVTNDRGTFFYMMVGLDGLEPTTSVLSGPRSSHLSYRPTLWVVAKSHLRIIATGPSAGKLTRI